MSELVAISFDTQSSPGLTVRAASSGKAKREPYGWGFGWYPDDEPTGVVIKDPTSGGQDALAGVLRDWERFRSSLFLCHLRGATKRARQRDAQPFIKSYAGRQWIFAHNGDLREGFKERLPLGVHPIFEPLGPTDSEHIFCWLLSSFRSEGARRLADLDPGHLEALFGAINDLGTANLLLADGVDAAVYHDRNRSKPFYWTRLVPPHAAGRLESEEFVIDLERESERSRTLVVASTLRLTGADWTPMEAGQTLVLRRGATGWSAETGRPAREVRARNVPGSSAPSSPPAGRIEQQAAPQQAASSVDVSSVPVDPGQPAQATTSLSPASRTLLVLHTTSYRYPAPVEHSAHVFRLRPVEDTLQRLRDHSVWLTVDGPRVDYDDVFGNSSTHMELSGGYTELVIRAQSLVRVTAPPPLAPRSPSSRDVLPLVWMPWQRQMMLPYLLPMELPESELRALTEFALSFAARNDNDLLETVFDINRTINKDFAYVTGSTTNETTPYEVFVSRRGVCQDFANLFICMARLLDIPARYRVGYIYTGSDYENKIQSEGSHAWVELYLPWNGWRGFDPTNGCMTATDHIRVASGRNYRDATPTSGTIYRGGGGSETLWVDVRVEEALDGSTPPAQPPGTGTSGF